MLSLLKQGKTMEKETLKNLLNSLKENDAIELAFIKSFSNLNGTYKVNSLATTGRGQHGSRIMSLTNIKTNEIFDKIQNGNKQQKFGTPVADLLLYVEFEKQKYGFVLESQIQTALPKNLEASKILKNALEPLLNKKTPTKLKIRSTLSEFNGVWNLTSIKKNSGKYGQISLELDNGKTSVSLWSHRHGGVIQNIEEVEDSQ